MIAGVDFSDSRPAIAALKAAGVKVVMRYLTRAPGPKCLTVDEAHGYIAAGIGVGLNFEDAAGNALKGAAEGIADAQFANDLADQLGAPADAWIWYSCDTGARYQQVAPYYRAVHGAGGRPAAFYGPLPVGQQLKTEGVIVGVWVADAASWSGFKSWDMLAIAARGGGAHILQHLDHPLAGIPAAAYDFDEILQPFPTWGGSAPSPIIQEDPVSIICDRVASTVPGRDAFVTFDPATKTLFGFNGVEWSTSADPKVWSINDDWPANAKSLTATAKLLLPTNGNLGYAIKADGSAIVITADGDGGTFELGFHKLNPIPTPAPPAPGPMPPIDYVVLAKAVAPHISIAVQ